VDDYRKQDESAADNLPNTDQLREEEKAESGGEQRLGQFSR